MQGNDNTSGFALRVLTMLLPFILATLPPVLDKLFEVLYKALLSYIELDETQADHFTELGSPVESYKKSVTMFLFHLFDMFPCSLLSFLRGKSATAPMSTNKLKVLSLTGYTSLLYCSPC